MRRVFSMILAVLLMIQCWCVNGAVHVTAADLSYPLTLDTLPFQTENSSYEITTYIDNEISTNLKDGKDVRATAEVERGQIVLALYEGQQLQRLVIGNLATDNLAEATMPSVRVNNRTIVKVFLFDAIENLRPLCSGVCLTKQINDFDAIKENWRAHLVGEPSNDIEDDFIRQRIIKIEQDGQNTWNTMNYGENIPALFGTSEITSTGLMTGQYNKLYKLAQAYGTYGSSLYHNSELKEDILYGLEWLYNNLYGQAEIDGTGWKSMTEFNWWDWFVGVPTALTNTLMIMEPEIAQEDIEKYLSPFNYIRSWMRTGKNQTNASSRMYAATAADVLGENVENMNERMEDIDLVLQQVEVGDGIHEDYTYICHTNIPYNGA